MSKRYKAGVIGRTGPPWSSFFTSRDGPKNFKNASLSLSFIIQAHRIN